MSTINVNVLVEGRDVDGYVYDQLAAIALAPRQLTHVIIYADEIQGTGVGGGKDVLLSFFRYLRGAGALGEAGRYATAFCVDKDVDDLSRRKVRSGHVIYTPTYDIEGLLMREVDVCAMAAAAVPATTAETAFLEAAGPWCALTAAKWTEWVALCLTARSVGAHHANYGARSRVNAPIFGNANQGLVATVIGQIANASGHLVAVVEARYRARVRQIKALQMTGNAERVFKGKWYLDILAAELVASLGRGTSGQVRAGLQAALLAMSDYGGGWGEPIRAGLTGVAAAL